MCVCVYIYIYIYVCVYIYICIYICVYIYIYDRTQDYLKYSDTINNLISKHLFQITNHHFTLLNSVKYDIPPEIHNHTSFLFYIKIIGRKIYEHYNNWMCAVTASPQHAASLASAAVTIIPPPSC